MHNALLRTLALTTLLAAGMASHVLAQGAPVQSVPVQGAPVPSEQAQGAPVQGGLPSKPAAAGPAVSLQGIMGSKALLVIDGKAPRALGPGESVGEVRVLSVQGEQAKIAVAGTPVTLRLGETQSSIVGKARPAGGVQISMASDVNGHFMADGQINGKSARFMVDTGATTMAMSLADAVKLGVDYRKGRPIQVNTANGVVSGYALKLHSVRIGDVEVYDVDAVVTQQRMPFVLLGNSFLNRFQMRRDADIMVLTRR